MIKNGSIKQNAAGVSMDVRELEAYADKANALLVLCSTLKETK